MNQINAVDLTLYYPLEASTTLAACCGLADQTSVPEGPECLLLLLSSSVEFKDSVAFTTLINLLSYLVFS